MTLVSWLRDCFSAWSGDWRSNKSLTRGAEIVTVPHDAAQVPMSQAAELASAPLRDDAGAAALTKTKLREGLPEEHAWVGGPQSYVACAFYTANYLPMALALHHSLEEHRINHFLKRYERSLHWAATTRLKPGFICECLKRFPDKDVLYLDADAVVRAPLTFFDDVKTDIALWPHPKKKRGRWDLHVTACTMLVRNTPGGRRFAQLWRDTKLKSPLATDEEMLHVAFRGFAGISFTVVPTTYAKIFDQPGDPVIEQFQASRGQFNWRRALRKTRQKALVAGAVLLAVWVFSVVFKSL